MDGRAGSLVFAALALAACGSDRLARSHEGLDLSPGKIQFPTTYLGHPTSRVISLHNEGRITRTATLHVDAPFALARDSVDIGGGADEEVDVTFAPEKVGAFTAEVTVAFEDQTTKIALAGEAKEAPVCQAETCRVVDFDPATGQCTNDVAPDGTACRAPCLDDGECVSGVCHGVPKSCDDGDVCTRDSCDPAVGCVHDTVACAPPSDPCEVGVCDSTKGCTTAPAADGTVCGAVSCTGAHLCFSGVCQQVQVPDGFACGNDSPCQDPGECHQGSCEMPPPKPLEPEWTVPVSADQLDFTGTADDDGNVYWGERNGDELVVVSYTSDGFERWRTPIAGSANHFGAETMPGKLAVVGDLVVSTLTFDHVVALHRADGSIAWDTNLEDHFGDDPQNGALELIDVGPLVSTDFGLVVRDERFYPANTAVDLLRMDPASGAVDGSLEQGVLASDQHDSDWYPTLGGTDLFVATAFGASRNLFDIQQPDGTAAWQNATDFLPYAREGRFLLGNELFESGLFDIATQQFDHGYVANGIPPLASPTTAVLVGQECASDDCTQLGDAVSFETFGADGTLPRTLGWLTTHGTVSTWPLLLPNDGLLATVSETAPVQQSLLVEAPGDGSSNLRCPFASNPTFSVQSILTHGHYIVATPNDVRSYALPKLDLASHGYVAAFGSLARDGRPR